MKKISIDEKLRYISANRMHTKVKVPDGIESMDEAAISKTYKAIKKAMDKKSPNDDGLEKVINTLKETFAEFDSVEALTKYHNAINIGVEVAFVKAVNTVKSKEIAAAKLRKKELEDTIAQSQAEIEELNKIINPA